MFSARTPHNKGFTGKEYSVLIKSAEIVEMQKDKK
jgi:hypothetical protein